MEKKLEQLLNSLIQRGRVPFGEGWHRSPYKKVSIHKNHDKERTYVLFDSNNHSHWKVLRQVVSRESGLWQFVCENGMIKGRIKIEDYPAPRENKKIPTYKEWTKQQRGEGKQGDCVGAYPIDNYGYRLMESALKDEEELEQLLLDNIKVGNEQL